MLAAAQPPTHRPVWLIVLALAMLLFGGLTLIEGLLTIRDPKALSRLTPRDVALTSSQEEIVRKIAAINAGVIDRHQGALRLKAAFGIVFGLWTLYATAAVLSRDRHGRVLALTTAVLGTAHRLAVVPLVVGMAREAAEITGPLLAELAAGADSPGASLAEVVHRMEIRRQVVAAAVGIGWWLLVFLYFGGRRGRELYGLPPR
jgi:hypothetical protein